MTVRPVSSASSSGLGTHVSIPLSITIGKYRSQVQAKGDEPCGRTPFEPDDYGSSDAAARPAVAKLQPLNLDTHSMAAEDLRVERKILADQALGGVMTGLGKNVG